MFARFALAFTLFSVGGCAAVSTEGASQPESALTVQIASPPPTETTVEQKPAAPGFGYIWVAGYWDYLDGHYVWRSGRWMEGKREFEYVRARYEFDGKGWVFHRPHWKRRVRG